MFKVSLGQDSHRLEERGKGPTPDKVFILGGVEFEEPFYLCGNSDADVLLHALTNAISGITGIPVLGPRADALCRLGEVNSQAYLNLALQDLQATGYQICHLSFSLECLRPKIFPKIDSLRQSLERLLNLERENIALTATTGEGLTDFGKGLGIQVLCMLTAIKAQLS